jgi:transglutaminase-like putative cysteine protease
VYLPGSGWVEFDPTNGIVGNRDLIRVAVARNPDQAIPLSGVYWGDRDDDLGMEVEVNVKTESAPPRDEVNEDPLLAGVTWNKTDGRGIV